jgi:hypothetical protein
VNSQGGDASKLSINRPLKSKWSSFHQSHTDHIKSCLRRITGRMSGRVRQTLSNVLSRYYEPESEGEKEGKRRAKIRSRREGKQIRQRMKCIGKAGIE